MKKKYVQYGCGNVNVQDWLNFDASPTLRIQKIPLIGNFLKPYLNCIFDDKIMYGDIVKGLPIKDNSADAVFCSHVLEHLYLEDFYKALENTYKILKPSGVFRCIVPDLNKYIADYITSIKSTNENKKVLASLVFCKSTSFGKENRKKGIKGVLSGFFGNSVHRWMWDEYSLTNELKKIGFINIKYFSQGLSDDKMLLLPEKSYQFENAIAVQCEKPK